MVLAEDCSGDQYEAQITGVNITIDEGNLSLDQGAEDYKISIYSPYIPIGSYRLVVWDNGRADIAAESASELVQKTSIDQTMVFSLSTKDLSYDDWIGWIDTKQIWLYDGSGGSLSDGVCRVGKINIRNENLTCSAFDIYQVKTFDKDGDGIPEENKCYTTNNGCIDDKSPIIIANGDLKSNGQIIENKRNVTLKCGLSGFWWCTDRPVKIIDGHLEDPIIGGILSPSLGSGTYSIGPPKIGGNEFAGNCQSTFVVRGKACDPSLCSETPPSNQGDFNGKIESFKLCSQVSSPKARAECESCAGITKENPNESAGVWTAIGCIKREPTSIVQSLVKLGLGIGGGVSLIMTLAGGFLITTSQGDPKRAEQAKEMITSAIVGLLIIIFSVTILQFIGFDILRIPGFGTS